MKNINPIIAVACLVAFGKEFNQPKNTYDDEASFKADQKTVKEVEKIVDLTEDSPEHWARACDRVDSLVSRWRFDYSESVNSDFTCTCGKCGKTLVGDEPAIEIECLECYLKERIQ